MTSLLNWYHYQKLNRNEGKAQNMIDEFRTLRDNVNDFAKDWQQVIDKHKKERLTYLEQLDQHIAKLMGTLVEYVLHAV